MMILSLFVTIYICEIYFSYLIIEDIFLILEMIMFISLYHHQFYHESFTISLLLMITKIISKIISLNIIQIATRQSIHFILTHQNYYDFMLLIEIILFMIACINIYLLKLKKSINFNHKNWKELQILLLIIITFLFIFEFVILNNLGMNHIILIMSIVLLALSIFFIFTYDKILQLSQENTEYLLNEQKYHYRSINKDTLLKANEEMKSLEHRMTYSLLQIKNSIINQDDNNALLIIDQYFKKINQYKSTILTDNPYFDFVINSKINALYNDGYTFKMTSTINCNPILEDKNIVNIFMKIIDYYVKLSIDKDLILDFIDKGDYLLFTITTQTLFSCNIIQNEIKEFINDNVNYHVKSNNNYVTCQLLFKNNYFIS
ncbi:hypothetical protein [Candidatus Stoquefichus massiliensis]|uniref:hypothetical protein n=1 Tax=Candidatus Stoquefichus massiliensis TaxID=1470350 RepID=UPI00164D338D|nr:hypothetical protein [Candidatus Stoquefichus massiliensis]